MWALFNVGCLEITKSQAAQGCHAGNCSDGIKQLSEIPKIRRQLNKLDPEKLKEEFREYGAWDEEELQNHQENLQRILFEACGQIVDNH